MGERVRALVARPVVGRDHADGHAFQLGRLVRRALEMLEGELLAQSGEFIAQLPGENRDIGAGAQQQFGAARRRDAPADDRGPLAFHVEKDRQLLH